MKQEEIWDAVAERWFHFRQMKFKPVYNFLKKYKLRKGKILEVGCGNARNLVAFAKLDFDCYGIDFSKKMLEFARNYAKKNDVDLRLLKAEMTKLPFKTDFFDYILHLSSLHNLETREQRVRAVKEAYRVLKRDGLMLLTVWNKLQLKFIFKSKDVEIPWSIRGKEYDRFYHLFDYFELRRLVKTAGFKILESNVFGENLVFVLRK